MSKKTQKDIWDVIFSLDKSFFPLSCNYLKEPRGSFNHINSKVNIEPKKKYLDFAESMNPVDLYALDFELNLLFRKLADFILFADKNDVWDESPAYGDVLFNVNEKVDSLLEKTELYTNDLIIEAYTTADAHIIDGENLLDYISEQMRHIAQLQYAIEYYIENSDWDWRTKAEAYLRSHYLSEFEYADDETLIFLNNNCASGNDKFACLEYVGRFDISEFDINNKIHKLVSDAASQKWKLYKESLDNLTLFGENPFDEEGDISGLRNSRLQNVCFLNDFFYDSESKHLLSKANVMNFCKALNTFRSDLKSKKVQRIISGLFDFAKNNILKSSYTFGYDYTIGDRIFLLSLLYHYLGGRFSKIEYDGIFLGTQEYILIEPWNLNSKKRNWSTLDYCNADHFLPLICFNMFAVYYSKPHGYRKYIQETSEKIVNKQCSYGYWYDYSFNPELMTVLALEASNIEQGAYQSFPHTKIDYLPKDKIISEIPTVEDHPETPNTDISSDEMGNPYVEYDHYTKKITFGNKVLKLSNNEMKVMEALLIAKFSGFTLPVRTEMKSGIDSLRRKVGGKDAIKHLINFIKISREKGGYELAKDVKIKNYSSVASQRTYQK